MRQNGIFAAAALHALDHHLSRLPEDHANARAFAETLIAAGVPVQLDLASVQTNIVVFQLPDAVRLDAPTLSARARERKLSPADMQGGCFTISSLGGIGGTAFTPIINAPEVAILGVSRAVMRPVYRNGTFEPRLMLPLSLSYDHRVIDGAVAARFIVYFSGVLADIRRILL